MNLSRTVFLLYLVALGLLPWTWFPPFPWLHEHAQWSDVFLAAAAVAWVLERWRAGAALSLRPVHFAMALYLTGAALSVLLAAPDRHVAGLKFVGMVELSVIAVLTADLATDPRMVAAMARVIAITSLLMSAGALLGVALFYAGVQTSLIGGYGGLVPGSYARAQAGLYHPSLLASFCVFASAVLAHADANLPARLRRTVQAALAITVLLTFSRGIIAFGLAAVIRAACRRGRRLTAGIFAGVCVLFIGLLSVLRVSFDPSHPLAFYLKDKPSPHWRAMTSSLRTLVAHPLWGAGPGTHPGLLKEGMPFDAHLTPLNIAATLGIPALVGFLTIPVALWWWRRRPTDTATWSGLAGLGLDALAQDVEDFRHLWVLFGLADRAPQPRNSPIMGERSR